MLTVPSPREYIAMNAIDRWQAYCDLKDLIASYATLELDRQRKPRKARR